MGLSINGHSMGWLECHFRCSLYYLDDHPSLYRCLDMGSSHYQCYNPSCAITTVATHSSFTPSRILMSLVVTMPKHLVMINHCQYVHCSWPGRSQVELEVAWCYNGSPGTRCSCDWGAQVTTVCQLRAVDLRLVETLTAAHCLAIPSLSQENFFVFLFLCFFLSPSFS